MTQTSNQEFLRDFENMVMQTVVGGGTLRSTRDSPGMPTPQVVGCPYQKARTCGFIEVFVTVE